MEDPAGKPVLAAEPPDDPQAPPDLTADPLLSPRADLPGGDPDTGAADPARASATEPAPAAPAPRRGGFVPALLGGAIALAAGFAVAEFDLLNLRPAPDDSALTALDQRIATLEQGLAAARSEAQQADAALGERLDTLPPAAADTSALEAELAALSDRLTKLESDLSALPAEGAALSPAQLSALSASVETLRSQVAALQAGLDEPAVRAIVDDALAAWETAAAEKMQAEAQAAEAASARAAALLELQQAASSGAPFDTALPALGPDLPEIVTRYAGSGLPSLTESFPEPARRALDAALRAQPGEGMGDRFLSFLKLQTGARSLTPREGDDPDAILSRAEAAVAVGQVQAALDELAALPPEAQAELADWTALAQDHLAFEAAVQTLSQDAKP